MRKKTMIIYNIMFLCFLYISVAAIFSLMYILLDFLKLGFIKDHYSSSLHQEQYIDILTRSFYFSITTLFCWIWRYDSFGLSKELLLLNH